MSAKIKAAEVRKNYEELDKDKLLDEVVDLVLENEKLRKKLKKYENPHTPSSKKGFEKPQAQGIPVGRKKGKVYQHKRTTRPIDVPNMPPVTVIADFNPSNGNVNIEETGYVIERIITDFKIEKIVTKYTFLEYKDLDTGELFYAKHPNVPGIGVFGKNIITLANLLHFDYRVTLQGVAGIFATVFDISMSPPTVQELCNRAAEKALPVYKDINVKLRESEVVNADETGSNQNGKSEWQIRMAMGLFHICPRFFCIFPAARRGDS